MPSVALLRVSIALRSQEHYRVIKASRVGRLRPPFRNKLGWLTGNLFSRVDTPDWPEEIGPEEARKKVDRILRDVDEAADNVWVAKKQLDFGLSKDPSIKGLPKHDVKAALQPFAPPKPKDAVIAKVVKHMPLLLDVILFTDIKAAAELLRSDRAYMRLVTERMCAAAGAILDASHLAALAGRLRSDARMRESAAASLDQFAAEFFRARGVKDYPNLSAAIEGRPVLDGDWMALLAEHLDATGVDEAIRPTLLAALEGLKPDEAMVDFLTLLVKAGAAKGLGERLAKRLRGDAVMDSLFATQS